MTVTTPVGFDEFYEKEYRSLVGFALRLGAGTEDAEDAVQNAFECLLIAWERVDDPAAWTRVVVRRGVYRVFRTGRYASRLAAALRGRDHGEVIPDPSGEGTDLVMSLLHRLPPDEAVVIAWAMEGYSDAEIADLERPTWPGITTRAVTNARRRARARLVRWIEKEN